MVEEREISSLKLCSNLHTWHGMHTYMCTCANTQTMYTYTYKQIRKFLEEIHILDFCVSEQRIPLDENVICYLLTEIKDLL